MRLHTIWFLLLAVPALVVCAVLPLERRKDEWWTRKNVGADFDQLDKSKKIPYSDWSTRTLHGILYTGPMTEDKLPPSVGIEYNYEMIRQPIFVLAQKAFLVFDIPVVAAKALGNKQNIDAEERAREIAQKILEVKIELVMLPLSSEGAKPYDPVYDCADQKKETWTVETALKELERRGGKILDNGIGVVNLKHRKDELRNKSVYQASAKLFEMGLAEPLEPKEGYTVLAQGRPNMNARYLVLSYTKKGPRVAVSGQKLVWPKADSTMDNQKLERIDDKTPFLLTPFFEKVGQEQSTESIQ